MTGDTITMSGDFRGANVFVKTTLSHVNVGVWSMAGVDDAAKAELQGLVARLNEALQRVPPEKAEEAEAVAASAKQLVEAAQGERPNRTLLRVAADGLRQAAQTLAAAAPPAVGIATQIVELIAKVRGL